MKRLVMVGLALVALSGAGCKAVDQLLGLTDNSDAPREFESRQVLGTIPADRAVPFNTLGGGVRFVDIVEVAPAATPTAFQSTGDWRNTTTGGIGTVTGIQVDAGQPGDALRLTVTAFKPE